MARRLERHSTKNVLLRSLLKHLFIQRDISKNSKVSKPGLSPDSTKLAPVREKQARGGNLARWNIFRVNESTQKPVGT